MAVNTHGDARRTYCGVEIRMVTLCNRDMQGLCNAWRRRHETACKSRTPAQRRVWAARYTGNNHEDGGVVVDLRHPGFCDAKEFP